MTEVSGCTNLMSPSDAAEQILASLRGVDRTRIRAVTASEGLALNRAFQAITAPQIRTYVIELVEALRARASGQD